MSFINLVVRYFFWHYTIAFVDFFYVWKNFFWFCFHFFSMSTMLRTLFYPWKRIKEERSGGLENFFASLIVNTIMRTIGFLMRTILLLLGVLSLFGVFVLGVISLVFWIFMPVLIFAVFIVGVKMLFK